MDELKEFIKETPTREAIAKTSQRIDGLERKQNTDHDMLVSLDTTVRGMDKKLDTVQNIVRSIESMCGSRKIECFRCFAETKDVVKLEAELASIREDYEKKIKEEREAREREADRSRTNSRWIIGLVVSNIVTILGLVIKIIV